MKYQLEIVCPLADEERVSEVLQKTDLDIFKAALRFEKSTVSFSWYFDSRAGGETGLKPLKNLLPENVEVNLKRIKLLQPDFKSFNLESLNVIPFKSGGKTKPGSPGGLLMKVGDSFGIGMHPTTRLCVKWIRHYAKSSHSMYDIGSGSGILMLAAFKFKIARVRGVESHRGSVRISRENIRLNRALNLSVESGMLKMRCPRQMFYDLVCANLESRLLEMHCDEIISWVRPGGKLILSGMIRKNRKSVLDTYRCRGFRLCGSRTSGEWCSVVLKGGPA